jgi:hypothetical protein
MSTEVFSKETKNKEVTPEKQQNQKVLMTFSDYKRDCQNEELLP